MEMCVGFMLSTWSLQSQIATNVGDDGHWCLCWSGRSGTSSENMRLWQRLIGWGEKCDRHHPLIELEAVGRSSTWQRLAGNLIQTFLACITCSANTLSAEDLKVFGAKISKQFPLLCCVKITFASCCGESFSTSLSLLFCPLSAVYLLSSALGVWDVIIKSIRMSPSAAALLHTKPVFFSLPHITLTLFSSNHVSLKTADRRVQIISWHIQLASIPLSDFWPSIL